MGKVLLTKKNYKEHLDIIDQTVYMAGDFIVTPGVKDILRNQGIAIKYGCRPERSAVSKSDSQIKTDASTERNVAPVDEKEQGHKCGQKTENKKNSAEDVARLVRQVLENSFDTVDENMIEEVLRRLLKVYTF